MVEVRFEMADCVILDSGCRRIIRIVNSIGCRVIFRVISSVGCRRVFECVFVAVGHVIIIFFIKVSGMGFVQC